MRWTRIKVRRYTLSLHGCATTSIGLLASFDTLAYFTIDGEEAKDDDDEKGPGGATDALTDMLKLTKAKTSHTSEDKVQDYKHGLFMVRYT